MAQGNVKIVRGAISVVNTKGTGVKIGDEWYNYSRSYMGDPLERGQVVSMEVEFSEGGGKFILSAEPDVEGSYAQAAQASRGAPAQATSGSATQKPTTDAARLRWEQLWSRRQVRVAAIGAATSLFALRGIQPTEDGGNAVDGQLHDKVGLEAFLHFAEGVERWICREHILPDGTVVDFNR